MPTKSFYENLVIDTEEKCQALLRAFEEADRRPPEEPMVPDIEEIIKEGERWVDEGGLDGLIKKQRP